MKPPEPAQPPVREAGDEERPMGAVYIAVIVVEIVTLAALWWFQTTFGHA